jgi:hypothetical protein
MSSTPPITEPSLGHTQKHRLSLASGSDHPTEQEERCIERHHADDLVDNDQATTSPVWGTPIAPPDNSFATSDNMLDDDELDLELEG